LKRVLSTIFILLFAFQMVLGQKIITVADQEPIQSYDTYIKKQKTNKTAAWICLGSGIVITVAGLGFNMGGGF